MRLLITCDFENATQTLVFDGAAEGDLLALRAAKNGDPDLVLGVPCQISPGGPVQHRLIRAGCIRDVEEA